MSYADAPTIILGADGFLGRSLAGYFAARGWPTHLVGRAAGDFTQSADVNAAFAAAPKAARILHAITRQRTGAVQYDMQGELLADNARIHLNVLEAWRRLQPQAKLISLGSSCTYPEAAHPQDEQQFGLGQPHPSVRGYALAKKLLVVGSETYAAQYGLDWLHCVLATVYGPHAHVEAQRSHFMAAMIDRAVHEMRAGAGVFRVWGDPATVRDLLHVSDQIEAILAAESCFARTIVNCTANAPVTIGACAAAIVRVLGWAAEVAPQPGTFQGTSYKSLDSSRLLKATNWSPKITLEAGIASVIAQNYPKEPPA